jgi:transcriptional regulator with XRE-family HTH domain
VAKTEREIIGEAVLRYRRRAGLSQEALAEKADVHPNYVGRIERGECSATVGILLKLTRALGIRPYKLFLGL